MKTFVLTEDQTMIRDLARDLAKAEIMPRSEEVDHAPCCPVEGMAALAEAGLIVCTAPEELGGAGLDAWSQLSVIEETAKECASTAWAVANTVEVAECVLKHGTAAQKEQTVPGLIGGGFAAAAGSDAVPGAPLTITANARKTEDGYVLNGVKKDVPNIGNCDWYLVAAQDGEALRWFLVSKETAGLRMGEKVSRLGMKGCAMGDLFLENCYVSANMLVEGDVLSTLRAAQTLDMAAIAAGVAQGAMNEAIQYVNQRVQFGKTIAQFQNTQQVMAELLAKIEAARALVWDAAYVKNSGEDYTYAAALAKLAATDIACAATRKCVQFMGGYGYSREYPVERKMRDAKMTELLCGASSVQRALIAQAAVLLH